MFSVFTVEMIVIEAYTDLVTSSASTEERTRLLNAMINFSRIIRL